MSNFMRVWSFTAFISSSNSTLAILLSVLVSVAPSRLLAAANQGSSQSKNVSYTFTEDQVAAMFRARAAALPSELVRLGYSKIGRFEAQSFINELSQVPVEFVAWTSSPNGTKSARYFTRFVRDQGRGRVMVNAKLWFSMTSEAQSAIALNAMLSALGYNDALYCMTTAIWFFAQPEFRQALRPGQFNFIWQLVQPIFVKLPDAPSNYQTDPAEPLLSQLPPHFGKVTQSSSKMASFGPLRADGLTIYMPIDLKPEGRGSQTALLATPTIPPFALASGGGDWGALLLKQSMIHAHPVDVTSPDAAAQSGLLDAFRLDMILNYEVNWVISEAK